MTAERMRGEGTPPTTEFRQRSRVGVGGELAVEGGHKVSNSAGDRNGQVDGDFNRNCLYLGVDGQLLRQVGRGRIELL